MVKSFVVWFIVTGNSSSVNKTIRVEWQHSVCISALTETQNNVHLHRVTELWTTFLQVYASNPPCIAGCMHSCVAYVGYLKGPYKY